MSLVPVRVLILPWRQGVLISMVVVGVLTLIVAGGWIRHYGHFLSATPFVLLLVATIGLELISVGQILNRLRPTIAFACSMIFGHLSAVVAFLVLHASTPEGAIRAEDTLHAVGALRFLMVNLVALLPIGGWLIGFAMFAVARGWVRYRQRFLAK